MVLPTGVGKTVLFTEFIKALDLPTLIVVPTQVLLHQTGEKLEQFAPEIGYGKVYAYAKEHDNQVTITTYDSLVAGLRNRTIDPKYYKAIILDEVHESLSEIRTNAIKQFFDNSIVVGFTATDEYSEQKKVENLLDHEIHRMTIKEAVEGNLLSPLSCIVAKTEVDLSNILIKTTNEYDIIELERLLKESSINKACIDMYKQGFTGKQAIVFAGSIAGADEVREEFRKQGVICECLYGTQSPEEQKRVTEAYENGEVSVLVGVDLLTRGFDAPKASVCFNLIPTFSVVRATQRGGRVLRVDETDLAKHAYVVDFLYKDERVGKKPILFAQVADGSIVLPRGRKENDDDEKEEKEEGEKVTREPQGPRLPPFDVEGVTVITNSEEVLRITRELASQNEEEREAPEGWVTRLDLVNKYQIGRRQLDKLVHTYKDNEEMIKHYRNNSGQTVPHYSPTLIQVLERETASVGTAPEGWMTNKALADSLGVARQTTELSAKKFQVDGMIENYKTGRGPAAIHYSPELVSLVRAEISSRNEVPAGWVTHKKLKASVGVFANKRVSDIIHKHKEDPNMMREYKNTSGHTFTYFSPELVSLIRAEVSRIDTAPKDWVANRRLAELLSTYSSLVKNIANKYKENPNMMREYKNTRGQTFTYYSPEMVQIITEEVELRRKK